MSHNELNSYINNILNIASQLNSVWEPIAGSNKEKIVVDIIRSNLEEIAEAINIEPIEIGSWSEDFCYIETSKEIYPCSIHPPYYGEIDIEFKRSGIIRLQINNIDKIVNESTSDIIFVDMPTDPDDISTIANILKSYNPLVLVFIDKFNALRRIVVMDKTYCSYREAKILKYPVLHVPKEVGERILSNEYNDKIRIVAKADYRVGYGYNIIVDIYNGYDRTIYITAHHDHWLSGGSDNIMGIALVTTLVRMLRNSILRKNIRAIFFTAEEGFPTKLNSFYWLVGSRTYILNHRDEILDELELLLNFDVIYKGPIEISTSNIVLRNMLRRIIEKSMVIQHDNVVFDSYPFTLLGLPALTINTFTSVLSDGIYHTSIDLVDRIDRNTILSVLKLAQRLIDVVSNEELYVENIVHDIESELILSIQNRYIPLEILSELHRIIGILFKCHHLNINDIVRTMNMVITKAYVNKDVMNKLGIRETIGYLHCENNAIQLPTHRILETVDDIRMCMDEYLHNLEILAYILFKHCYTV